MSVSCAKYTYILVLRKVVLITRNQVIWIIGKIARERRKIIYPPFGVLIPRKLIDTCIHRLLGFLSFLKQATEACTEFSETFCKWQKISMKEAVPRLFNTINSSYMDRLRLG